MTSVLRRQHRAMATAFELVLCGRDEEHLDAVAAACCDELERIERLLSRFDPASEVSRINRHAGRQPVQIDLELWSILLDCREWWQRTNGYFDVTATAAHEDEFRSTPGFAVELDPQFRTVEFMRDGVRLDFGGYGKGYALDRMADIVHEFGIPSALLHGGTSSIVMIGSGPDGQPWPIGLRDPRSGGELSQWRLRDCALSSSAVLSENQETSDVIVPTTGRPLSEQSACTVIAADATTAEVLSTALLAMGKAAAVDYIGSVPLDGVSVVWIDHDAGQSRCRWITLPPKLP